MNELAERRRLLVMEAAMHRSLISWELAGIADQFDYLQTARARLSANSPLWVAGGAVAGLLTVRHWRTMKRGISVALVALRWIRFATSK